MCTEAMDKIYNKGRLNYSVFVGDLHRRILAAGYPQLEHVFF